MGNTITNKPSKEVPPKNLEKLKLLFSKSSQGIINISQRLPLKLFADEFVDLDIKSKIIELESTIPYYRRIRGDGNCFYRSIYFLLMELHFNKKTNNLFIFDLLFNNNDFDLTYFSFENEKLAKKLKKNNNLYEILKLLQKKLFDEPNIILDQFFSEEDMFDFTSIIFMRNLIFTKLQKSLIDPAIAPFITFPDTIKRKLLTYGLEAEDVIIPLTCSTLLIGLVIHILHISREGEKKVTLHKEEYYPFEIQSEEEKKRLPVFHLFFRPGHYDIAYPDLDEEFKCYDV